MLGKSVTYTKVKGQPLWLEKFNKKVSHSPVKDIKIANKRDIYNRYEEWIIDNGKIHSTRCVLCIKTNRYGYTMQDARHGWIRIYHWQFVSLDAYFTIKQTTKDVYKARMDKRDGCKAASSSCLACNVELHPQVLGKPG